MNSQKEKACPVCGSTNVEEYKTKDQVTMPFVNSLTFDIIENRCNECGEEGDFFGQNDEATAEAIEKLNRKSAVAIMEYLISNGRQMAYMERALRLPQRTMMRWKRGEISAGDLALLRILRVFPGLVEVAEEKFTKEATDQFIRSEAQNLPTASINLGSLEVFGPVVSSKDEAIAAPIFTDDTYKKMPRSFPRFAAGTGVANESKVQRFEPRIGNLG